MLRIAVATAAFLTFLKLASASAIAAGPTNSAWVKTFDAPRGLVIADIASDDAGNLYLAGHFWGRAVVGNVKLASEGEADIFVAKMKSDGEFVWVAHTGSTDSDMVERIGVDASGNSYVYGTQTRSSDGAKWFLIMKYDPQGKEVWIKHVAGSLSDRSYYEGLPAYEVPLMLGGYFFAVDADGDSFLIAPADVPQVVAFGPDGVQLWSSPVGDRKGVITSVNGIVGRKAGGVVLTGCFRDTLKIGAKTLIPGKAADFFVLCVDKNGTVAWVEQSESRGTALARGLALSGDDSAFVFVNLWADTAVGERTLKWDAGVAPSAGKPALVKYDRNGKVVWAVRLTGNIPWQFALAGMHVDASENIIAMMSENASYLAASLVSFDRNGNLTWCLQQAGKPHSMAIDSNGGIFLTITREDPQALWLSQVLKVESRVRPGGPPDAPPTRTDNASSCLALVSPKGTVGEFRHGTKCSGFYDAQPDGKVKLVDIQVAGKASSKSYTKTKSLVHAGVDIAAPEGSEIRPAADGTVDDVILSPNDENFGSLGYMVIVEHSEKGGGKPVYSLYSHMKEKPKVTVGQSVKAGETVLGLVGSIGAAFEPHVHFELRHFAGRFFPKWKNIYAIERPKDEATFDEADFAGNWLDPENPAGVKAPAGSRSESESQTTLPAPTLPAPEAAAEKRTGAWAWSTTSRITRQGQVTTLNYEHTVNLTFTGNSVAGTLETTSPDGHRAVREITDGTAKGDDFTFTIASTLSNGRKITTKYSGRLVGETIKGKIESESNGQSRANDWEARKKSPGQSPIAGPTTGSSDPLALEKQIKELITRPPRVPDPQDKVLSDEKQGVTVSYPAAFEVRKENRPVVAFFLAPSGGEPEQNRPKISVTCTPMPLLNRNASLESVVNNTIAGTKSALANAAVTGVFETTLAGVKAQTFIATGTEEGVVRQKAVTIAICRNHILGVVLHATPETFPKLWDDYRRVCDSYVLH